MGLVYRQPNEVGGSIPMSWLDRMAPDLSHPIIRKLVRIFIKLIVFSTYVYKISLDFNFLKENRLF